jgi:hypothetical protein
MWLSVPQSRSEIYEEKENLAMLGIEPGHSSPQHIAILDKLSRLLEKWNIFKFVRFEVFTAVTMKNVALWDVALCRSCVNRRFEGTSVSHIPEANILHISIDSSVFFLKSFFFRIEHYKLLFMKTKIYIQ